jgi:hypothetical protein
MNPDHLLILGMGSVLFGLVFAIVASVKMFRMSEAQVRERRATGRVARLEAKAGNEGYTYAPIVEFQADNRKLEIEGWSSSPPWYQVGEEVTVYYLPSCPEKAQIISTREWAVAWMFLAIGIVFIFVGIILGVTAAALRSAPQAAARVHIPWG